MQSTEQYKMEIRITICVYSVTRGEQKNAKNKNELYWIQISFENNEK